MRKILHSQPRMLTRDHLAVANLVTLDYLVTRDQRAGQARQPSFQGNQEPLVVKTTMEDSR